MVLYVVALYGGYVGFCSKLVLKVQELHLFTADFEHFWLIGDYAGWVLLFERRKYWFFFERYV